MLCKIIRACPDKTFLDDIDKILNKSKHSPPRNGAVSIRYKDIEAIVNPKSMIIITIKPIQKGF